MDYKQNKAVGDLAKSARSGYSPESHQKRLNTRSAENATEFGHCSKEPRNFRNFLALF